MENKLILQGMEVDFPSDEQIVFNEEKSGYYYLKDLDLEKGKIEERTETIHHEAIETIEEESHYEVIAEYPNGGKDVKKVIDKPGQQGQEAYDEEVTYQVYIPYTEKDIQLKKIEEELKVWKEQLTNTDYHAIKYAEGWYTDEEYWPIRSDRETWRISIRQLEKEKAILLGESYEEEIERRDPKLEAHLKAVAEEEVISEEAVEEETEA